MTRTVLLALAVSLIAGAASAQSSSQPQPLPGLDRLRDALTGRLGPAALPPEQSPPRDYDTANPPPDWMIPANGAPSRTWGYIVYRMPEGEPVRLPGTVPRTTLYFRSMNPSGPTPRYFVTSVVLNDQGSFSLTPSGLGYRYEFFLEQRATGAGNPDGVRRDPARAGAIYDPERFIYLGFSMYQGVISPPSYEDPQSWNGTGFARPPYSDLVNFTD